MGLTDDKIDQLERQISELNDDRKRQGQYIHSLENDRRALLGVNEYLRDKVKALEDGQTFLQGLNSPEVHYTRTALLEQIKNRFQPHDPNCVVAWDHHGAPYYRRTIIKGDTFVVCGPCSMRLQKPI